MDHHIDELTQQLWNKKSAKLKYRRTIMDAWLGRCAYCHGIADSLDHIRAKSLGGETSVRNLIPACMPCNRSKGSASLSEWFRHQVFYCPEREARIWEWQRQNSQPDIPT